MNDEDYILRGKYMVMLYHRSYRIVQAEKQSMTDFFDKFKVDKKVQKDAEQDYRDNSILNQFNLWFYIDTFEVMGYERLTKIESPDFRLSDLSDARLRIIGKCFNAVKDEMMTNSKLVERYLDSVRTEK